MTNGSLGALPDWYPVIKAAQYLQVAPWDLMRQPKAWITWAHQAQAAEQQAEAEVRKQEERRQKAMNAAKRHR